LSETVETRGAEPLLVGLGKDSKGFEHGTPPSPAVLEKAFQSYKIEMELGAAV
jgi:hypothetical protein